MNYILLILSVLIGSLFLVFVKLNKLHIRLLLSFSGAYLLSVTVLHLLPEIYEHQGSKKELGILILVGILIQSIIESVSKGAEHGHVHVDKNQKSFPWLIFLALSLHAFSEGLPIHTEDVHDNNLLWAIIVHKIPIAIVLTTFLIESNYKKREILFFMLFFSLMTPLGFFLGNNISWLLNHHQEITALIIGVFLHISTVILFESSENHKFNIQKFAAILLGMLLTIFTLH